VTWLVRLSDPAERDFDSIIRWTEREFGFRQANRYAELLSCVIEDLTDGPGLIHARSAGDVSDGLFSLHIARRGRKGRHVFYFRAYPNQSPPIIHVIRILHDSMDVARHLPESGDDTDA